MVGIIGSPGRYVQGRGVICEIGKHTSSFGKKAFCLADKYVLQFLRDPVTEGFKQTGTKVIFEEFGGECSKKEIARVCELVKSSVADFVVGLGGGKTLDTAKAVAYEVGLPVVIVPTAASTDAPCSALSVIYTEDGVFEEYRFYPKNPEVVLVDSEVIARAPVRLLVAGMGDALATYYEARATAVAGKANVLGGKPTKTALVLAELCLNTLLEKGFMAKKAAEAQVVTEALEEVIEANTYLSGLGFESGGLAAAHAIHNGLTALEETHEFYHGEKVAFGTVVQLVLENAPFEEIKRVVDFCRQVGLPVTLAELGVEELDKSRLMRVADLSCKEGETIHNMPFTVTPQMVCDAILAADNLARSL